MNATGAPATEKLCVCCGEPAGAAEPILCSECEEAGCEYCCIDCGWEHLVFPPY